MQNNSELSSSPVEITVESLGGLGDGIATYQGKPLFIAKSCAGDRLSVRIDQSNQERHYGSIVEILQPGPQRRVAPCPHYAQCGGCVLQHLDDEYYREFKTRILRNSLSLAGFPIAAEVVFLPAPSRRRVELKAHHIAGKITLAFYAPRSHTHVPIATCLVLTPGLEALIQPLNGMLSTMPFADNLRTVSLTEADTGIDMVLTFDTHHAHPLAQWQEIAKKLGIARISLHFPGAPAAVTLQRTPVAMQLGDYSVPLLADAFLQATAQGQMLLTNIAVEAVKSSSSVIDLFAGMGTYSFPLSAYTTHAVEGDGNMARMMQETIKQHTIASLSATQRDLFKNPLTAQELAKFDAAIINPPRIGAKAQVMQLAESSINTVVMISCNPATFTRDAKILKASGFTLASAQGIDQFIWSPHLEIAAVFKR